MALHTYQNLKSYKYISFSSSCLSTFACYRYHRDHRPVGLGLGDRQESFPQVPFPQSLPDPVWLGQPAFPTGNFLHAADGLRSLFRHLLWWLHGSAAACFGKWDACISLETNNLNYLFPMVSTLYKFFL